MKKNVLSLACLLFFSLTSLRVDAQLDTSLVSLDNPLSCGIGSQVRLLAGQAPNYQWLRNGSSIPGATSRQYNANSSGTYRVRVWDGLGNIDSSRNLQVLIVPNPSVGFSVNQSAQCFSGNYFQFSNTSTISQGTMTYTWYYGDGSFQLATNGAHTYAATGAYRVKLVATSNYGCVTSDSTTITVNSPPVVAFSVNNAAQCINANQFFFTNTTTGPNTPLTYLWNFGDGTTTSAPQPAYQYNQAGVFLVKLIATTQVGCKDSISQAVTVYPKPTVTYTVNNNRQCGTNNFFQFTNLSTISSGTLTHTWSFGDGVTSGVFSPSHSYQNPSSYSVKLIETSDKGCMDSLSLPMIVDPSPTALFSVNQTTACFQGHRFTFTNQSSVSAGNLQYFWDFGDGVGSSTSPNPSYSYLQAGTYRVTLLVSTANNCTAAYSINLFVNPTPSGSILSPSRTVICDGSFIQLTATPSSNYQWYRNGVAISGATAPTLNATEPGTYHVVFTNGFNCSSSPSNAIILTKVYPPAPAFVFDRSCALLPITFTNTSLVANSLPVAYSWDFGDGSPTGIQASPVYTYSNPGTYIVKLTITPTQCTELARSTQQILAIEPQIASIQYAPVNAVAGRDLQLQAREFSGASYQWSPTTGLNRSTISNPIFNHSDSVRYQINIVTAAGCRITDTLLVRIFAEKKIFVPDYFTPNGDGKNDRIAPFLVGVTKLNRFRIWNRWGQLLYQAADQSGWDGYYRGVLQPMETYIWTADGLDLDGKAYNTNGTFILVR